MSLDWSTFPETLRDALGDLGSTHPLDFHASEPGNNIVNLLIKIQPIAAKIDASIKTNPGVIVAVWRISNFFAKQGYAVSIETIILMLPEIVHTIANDLPTVIALLNATQPVGTTPGGMGDKSQMFGRK